MKNFTVTVLPHEITLQAENGANLLSVLQRAGVNIDAPCGGHGTCGKCRLILETEDGMEEASACKTTVWRSLTVHIPAANQAQIMTEGQAAFVVPDSPREGFFLAFDIGTTTVVCYLLDGITGKVLADASISNPQAIYGADVISRIQAAVHGELASLQKLICSGMENLIRDVCQTAKIRCEEICTIAVVGNPCMQQLFMGISPENLAKVPFAPVLTRREIRPARELLSVCPNAELLVVPDISGYVGADVTGDILFTRMYESEKPVLLIDIGTNGEMVLAASGRLIACSTSAGPALEGAKIHFGMRGCGGAIDHVWMEDGELRVSTIGGGEAVGICGSGLIDAAAVLLSEGVLNHRGRLAGTDKRPCFAGRLKMAQGQRVFYLTEKIYLTQDDIRELMLAKGAIAAGIELMANYVGISLEEIEEVLLAGAFGCFINPTSACEIGLIPKINPNRIRTVGNSAGGGARMIACSRREFDRTDELVSKTEFLELASLPEFRHCFARNMGFSC